MAEKRIKLRTKGMPVLAARAIAITNEGWLAAFSSTGGPWVSVTGPKALTHSVLCLVGGVSFHIKTPG